jgi:hypothetical protein
MPPYGLTLSLRESSQSNQVHVFSLPQQIVSEFRMSNADDVEDPLLCRLSLQVDQDWPCDEMDITKGEGLCQETKPQVPQNQLRLKLAFVIWLRSENDPREHSEPISTRAVSGIDHFDALLNPIIVPGQDL